MNRIGDMTPQMMVLGLLVDEKGTVYDVQRRLSDLFSSAAFPKNSAHTNLPLLRNRGYVRLVRKGATPDRDLQEVVLEGEAVEADGGGDLYEVTEAGIKHLRAWVKSSGPEPAVREAIHGKVEFATLDDLAELVVIVRAEAKACQLASDEAHELILSEQNRRVRMRQGHPSWQQELDDELTHVHLTDVALMWADVAKRRRKLAETLEKILHKHRPSRER